MLVWPPPHVFFCIVFCVCVCVFEELFSKTILVYGKIIVIPKHADFTCILSSQNNHLAQSELDQQKKIVYRMNYIARLIFLKLFFCFLVLKTREDHFKNKRTTLHNTQDSNPCYRSPSPCIGENYYTCGWPCTVYQKMWRVDTYIRDIARERQEMCTEKISMPLRLSEKYIE